MIREASQMKIEDTRCFGRVKGGSRSWTLARFKGHPPNNSTNFIEKNSVTNLHRMFRFRHKYVKKIVRDLPRTFEYFAALSELQLNLAKWEKKNEQRGKKGVYQNLAKEGDI